MKRKFGDETGLHTACNQSDSLLEYYLRDTMELLDELSMLIKLCGRHWETLRVGLDPVILVAR